MATEMKTLFNREDRFEEILGSDGELLDELQSSILYKLRQKQAEFQRLLYELSDMR